MKNKAKRITLRLGHGTRTAGAPSKEHERLAKALKDWASRLGFTIEEGFRDSSSRPDVMQVSAEGTHTYLFMGDAKVFENEPPSRRESIERINKYIATYANCLANNEIQGGYIAICTNSENGAAGWLIVLEALTVANDIVDSTQSPVEFQVEQLDDKTWITYG